MKTGRSWLEQAEKLGRGLETAVLTVLLLGLISIGFGQIVLRNVFSAGVSWADGSTQMLVLWIAVVGAVAATRDRRHIAINLAGRMLSQRLARVVAVIVNLFAMAVSATFSWYAFRFVSDTREFGDQLFAGLPAWPFQSILPIGFALIAYRFALQCVREIWRKE